MADITGSSNTERNAGLNSLALKPRELQCAVQTDGLLAMHGMLRVDGRDARFCKTCWRASEVSDFWPVRLAERLSIFGGRIYIKRSVSTALPGLSAPGMTGLGCHARR